MKIQLTVTGDTVEEIAAELRMLADKLDPQEGQDAPVEEPALKVHHGDPEKKSKKEKKAEKPADPEPEPEPEKVEETADEEEISPADAWGLAKDMLLAHWNANLDNPTEQQRVLQVAEDLGVEKFLDVPKERGLELLAKAREVTGG